MEQQITFDPRNKSFCFRMDAHDCFYMKTGKCSLDLTEKELKHFVSKENLKLVTVSENHEYLNYEDNSVMYCRLLAQDFRKNGVKSNVMVFSNNCGHYTLDWGQHRACISKRIGISSIPAEQLKQNETQCPHCLSSKTSLWYRIQAMFRRSYWFTIK